MESRIEQIRKATTEYDPNEVVGGVTFTGAYCIKLGILDTELGVLSENGEETVVVGVSLELKKNLPDLETLYAEFRKKAEDEDWGPRRFSKEKYALFETYYLTIWKGIFKELGIEIDESRVFVRVAEDVSSFYAFLKFETDEELESLFGDSVKNLG